MQNSQFHISLLTILFITVSCSWKHRDFVKSIEEPSDINHSNVGISPDLEKKFLVEDEVEEKVASIPKKSTTVKKNDKKSSDVKTKSKVQAPKSKTNSQKSKVVPKDDYPGELLALSNQAKDTWKQYQSRHITGDKYFLDINYLGMTVGKIMLRNNGLKRMNDKSVWHFFARFKSAPFYSAFYELDDTVDTYVLENQFLSTKYTLIQRESKVDIDDIQLYDREKNKTFWFYKKQKKKSKVQMSQSEAYIPQLSLDPFSVVFFFQGLPLNIGDKYIIPIVNKTKILTLTSIVEGKEKVQTPMGEMDAIKVNAVTQYTGDHLKSGEMTFWYSDDDRRYLIKAKAKIKIGSVTAEIVEIQ